MNFLNNSNLSAKEDEVYIRLSRSYWNDNDGIYQKIQLKFLKRKCIGFNMILDDCSMSDPKIVLDRVINLHECKDGIYKVIFCNTKIDGETGYTDEWDYKLIKAE